MELKRVKEIKEEKQKKIKELKKIARTPLSEREENEILKKELEDFTIDESTEGLTINVKALVSTFRTLKEIFKRISKRQAKLLDTLVEGYKSRLTGNGLYKDNAVITTVLRTLSEAYLGEIPRHLSLHFVEVKGWWINESLSRDLFLPLYRTARARVNFEDRADCPIFEKVMKEFWEDKSFRNLYRKGCTALSGKKR